MLIWLGQEEAHKSSVVGAKAANLSRLANQYPVPSGCCLTTIAFEEWVAEGQPDRLPAKVHTALVQACQQLSGDGQASEPCAVRSSAVDEDGHTASFAGQYESYLNVVGGTALHTAVLQCYQSAYTERVQAYYRHHSRTLQGIRLAVFIQKLIAADISFIAFGMNPVSGDHTEIVINATWGLGPSLVNGTVTPDSHIVNKADFSVNRQDIGTKQCMTIMIPGGGIQEVAVPRLMRHQPVLKDSQVLEIARLTRALETDMGWAVDIEGAYKAEALYVLQCRPITTLLHT